jgi:RNA chaperone Hfq
MAAINLQDTFLNRVRAGQQQVTLFLMNGFQMKGRITGSTLCGLLDSDGRQQMIFQARHLHGGDAARTVDMSPGREHPLLRTGRQAAQ